MPTSADPAWRTKQPPWEIIPCCGHLYPASGVLLSSLAVALPTNANSKTAFQILRKQASLPKGEPQAPGQPG